MDLHSRNGFTDLGRVGIKGSDHTKVALAEALVGKERRSEVSNPNQDSIPNPINAENLADGLYQRRNTVTYSRPTELAEIGEVLPNLSIGKVESPPEARGRDGLETGLLQPLKLPQIKREPLNRSSRYAFPPFGHQRSSRGLEFMRILQEA